MSLYFGVFSDCYDHYLSGKARDGIYKIKPAGTTNTYLVNCELVKQKGWTIIQRRQDGLTDFFQDWNTYKKGFGGTCTVKPVLSGHPNRTPQFDFHYQLSLNVSIAECSKGSILQYFGPSGIVLGWARSIL